MAKEEDQANSTAVVKEEDEARHVIVAIVAKMVDGPGFVTGIGGQGTACDCSERAREDTRASERARTSGRKLADVDETHGHVFLSGRAPHCRHIKLLEFAVVVGVVKSLHGVLIPIACT